MLWTAIHLATIGHENLAALVLTGTGLAAVAGAFLQSRKKSKGAEPTAPKNPPTTQKKNKRR
jgi:hypothetical protein